MHSGQTVTTHYRPKSLATHLLLRFELLRVEAVEQQGQEQVKDHEVAHDQRGQEDGEAGGCPVFALSPHAVPQWLNPFATQDAEDHHERVEKVVKIPPGREKGHSSALKYGQARIT